VMAELINSTLCEPGWVTGRPATVKVMRSERATSHQGPRSARSHLMAGYMGAISLNHPKQKSLLQGAGPYMLPMSPV
jgi:hypothetical protein